MKNFKEFMTESSTNEQTSQEALALKNVHFDFDNGYNIPASVQTALGSKVIGVMDWKTRFSSSNYAYLAELSNYDAGEVSDVRVKAGEKIFRYATEVSAKTGIAPFIKVNVLKGLAYFLTEESSSGETDSIKFETRSVKLAFLKLKLESMKEFNVI